MMTPREPLRHRPRSRVLAAAARRALGLLLVVGAASSLAPGPAGAGLEIQPSATCGECHRDIYRMWRQSAHSQSMEDQTFLNAFRETELTHGKEVSATCIRCHAPSVSYSGDVGLARRETWEGVSCDFCHRVTSVELGRGGPRFDIEPDNVKHGPIRDAESSAHDVAYSDLHESSRGCAGCHEFANDDGTLILSTYSEWRASTSAREGTTCQSCHMAVTRAQVVDPRVKRVAQAEVNLHEVPGGHSLEQLHKALRVDIDPRRTADGLDVDIALVNKGAGHAVPTGMPGRRVILAVEVRTSGGLSLTDSRTYTRSFVDASGMPVKWDGAYFVPGVKEVGDTRIAADETREETFSFAVPSSETAYVTVRLHYEHSPTDREEDRTWLTFYSEKRVLLPG